MGLSALGKMCVEGEQQQSKKNHYMVLAGDYRKFQADHWYTFQNPILFDPNKFIFLYPNYQEQQSALLQRWTPTIIDIKNIEYGQSRNQQDVVSTRWKYAIKRGVPIEYYKIIISVIFNKNFNNLKPIYDKLKNQTNFNDKVPLFGLESSNLKQAVNAPFLNDKGFTVLRQLLFLFKRKKGEHFYNRYIAHVTAILLIFFQDYQAYELVSTMMEQSSNMSRNRVQSYRWHMVFKQDQMKNLALLFYNIVGNNSQTVGKLQKHFDSNRIDKLQIFNRIVENFFYGFLPFPVILRIFILFLNEGVKIFFRVFYAMLVYAERQLHNTTSLQKTFIVIKKQCLSLNTAEAYALLKSSFNLNLKATLSAKLVESRIKKEQSERKYYFLPFIKGASQIVSLEDLQIIWGFLPFELKTYDLQLCYPLHQSEDEKLNIKDLLKSLQNSKFSIIMIKTTTDNIFGCFFIGSPHSQQSSSWYGNNLTFVFTLAPKSKKYSTTRQNNQFLFTGKNEFKVGSGGAGSAIHLKGNLEEGETYKCFTFRNDPLNNGVEGQFQIKYAEAFTLF